MKEEKAIVSKGGNSEIIELIRYIKKVRKVRKIVKKLKMYGR